MSIWTILDLEPTTDQALIRRAYARQLKSHRPDSDPEGYQRLREAFEQAKSFSAPAKLAAGNTEYVVCEAEVYSEPQWNAEREEAPPRNVGEQSCFSAAEINQLAQQLVDTVLQGMMALELLWLRVTRHGSLAQQQQFHQQLALALAEHPGLSEVELDRVSARLGWGLDEYDPSRVLPLPICEALFHQLRQTELARGWKQLQVESESGSYLLRMANRLLQSERRAVPLWVRLVPGLIAVIGKQVNQLQQHYPELADKLNPVLREFVQETRLMLSWGGIFLLLFWAHLFNQAIPAADINPVSALSVISLVAFYIFGTDAALMGLLRYPLIMQGYLLLEWVMSAMVAMALFAGLFWLAITLPQADSNVVNLMKLIVSFILLLVAWFAWPRQMPSIRRPGGMLSRIVSSPWLVLKSMGFSLLTLPIMVVYFLFMFIITLELLKLLP